MLKDLTSQSGVPSDCKADMTANANCKAGVTANDNVKAAMTANANVKAEAGSTANAEVGLSSAIAEIDVAAKQLLKGRVPQLAEWIDAWASSTSTASYRKQERIKQK